MRWAFERELKAKVIKIKSSIFLDLLEKNEGNISSNPEKGISFKEALQVPGVIIYSIIYFCVKAASYGVLFWLPTYLKSELGLNQVNYFDLI